MEGLRAVVGIINTILWDYLLIFGLVGIGVYMKSSLNFLNLLG